MIGKNPTIPNKHYPVIGWWSGGVTSAVACKLVLDMFGPDNCRIIFIDTKNEDDSTYEFKKQCVQWYNYKEIETITSEKFDSIQQVWEQFSALNAGSGAICSTTLKREVREAWQRENLWSYQAFGFDNEPKEVKRAIAMRLNYPEANAIFPLLTFAMSKKDCFKVIEKARDLFLPIQVPKTYQLGFNNNNCFKTGCVQGGIGYWQKMKTDFPEKFGAMAAMEHKLTNKAGKPVTMLRDQGKDGGLVFLLPHPDYPDMKDISMMKGRPVMPLVDCNGFCGTNDLLDRKNPTEKELNYSN